MTDRRGERPAAPTIPNAAHTIACTAQERPDAAALELWPITASRGDGPLRRWRYRDLENDARAASAILAAAGVRRGDRVLLGLGDSAAFPIAYLGALGLGAVATPLAGGLSAAELAMIAGDAAPAAAVFDAPTRRAAPDHIAETCAVLGAEVFESPTEPAAAPALQAWPAPVSAEAPAFLVYTSGSTGRPKGVLHAHRAIAARRMMSAGWQDLKRTDRCLHAGAFNWTYTLGAGLLDPWAAGATAVIAQARPDGTKPPEAWPDLIEAAEATIFAATPAHYRRIVKYAALARDRAPSLRHGLSAGEKLSDDLRETFEARTGRTLYEALGSTECSTFISFAPASPPIRGRVGYAQPGRKIAVLADDGAPAPRGVVGRLAVAADDPGLMLGYWRGPDAPPAAPTGDWFETGDLARMDAGGAIAFCGRADDQMNAMGHRVAPEEVEAALAGDPRVADVAAVQIPMPNGVAVIAAFVQPADPKDLSGAAAEALEAALRARAQTRLADYKQPRAYRFVAALPRTRTGKLQRRRLADTDPASP